MPVPPLQPPELDVVRIRRFARDRMPESVATEVDLEADPDGVFWG